MPLVCITTLRKHFHLAIGSPGAADGTGGRNLASSPTLKVGQGRGSGLCSPRARFVPELKVGATPASGLGGARQRRPLRVEFRREVTGIDGSAARGSSSGGL
jgi:hypothetical protein